MFKFILAVGLMLGTSAAMSQTKVSGVVRDAKTNEPLVGATVSLLKSNRVAVTNEQGVFLFGAVAESFEAEVRFLGYKPLTLVLTNDINEISLEQDAVLTDAVIVSATRVTEKMPTTFSSISKPVIQKQNFGQDLPFLLNWSPSLVTNSDAGTGIGYTGLRIRGSDATRINVTINGIPYNDSESHGVFWVNIPDIASSTQNIQVQRGVGTSTNGAGAFGASINLQTNTQRDQAYADVINSYGSFNTWRHTVGFGTGMINNKFAFDARLSKISSDGFIDRASSNLRSYYMSGGYYGKKSMLKAIVFGGQEITYQSWWGVPESRLKNDINAMNETASIEGWNAEQTNNLLTSNSRTFNIYTYENQVDNYSQDHYQLHFSHRVNEYLTFNGALHYTYGRGFYEEYRYDDDFDNYGLPDLTIGNQTFSSSDIIRRRWLDNDFYGATYSVHYEKEKWSSIVGGAANRYVGDHFGEIIWAQVSNVPVNYRYYFNDSDKRDVNVFWKNSYSFHSRWSGFVDVQYRQINYQGQGLENKQFNFAFDEQYNFFNPKLGLTYQLKDNQLIYASYSVGNREPVRSDFVDAPIGSKPKPENLRNLEAGFRYRKANHQLQVNIYHMDYRDQLVLTGKVNDSGAAIRTNVDKSYRLGLEIENSIQLNPKLQWSANLTLSENKIKNFNEVLYDYGLNFDEYNEVVTDFQKTDISFSPSIIAGSAFNYSPLPALELSLLSKYVGKQYLDNTSNEDRKLEGYFVNDLRISYSLKPSFMRELSFSFLLNNFMNEEYSSNGYTYGFFGGPTEYRQNYFYPQAGRNFLFMVSARF